MKKSINQKSLAIHRGIKQRRETLDRRINMGRIVLSDAILERLDSANVTQTDFDLITGLLASTDTAIRIEAAACLEELSNAWDGKSLCIRGGQTRTLLLKSIDDSDYRVQLSILRASAKKHLIPPDQAIPVVLPKLSHEVPDIQVAALKAIQSFGVDISSKFVDDIALLVNAPMPVVQLEACRTLKSFGSEGISAISELLKCLSQFVDAEVNKEAARAIMQIDPKGVSLQHVEESTIRSRLIDALRVLGAEAREYRLMLKRVWTIVKEPNFQLAGYSKADLGRLFNRDPKTIGRWIQSGKLPIRRMDKNLYFIDASDIENLLKSQK